MKDVRVWHPDATCDPIFWNTHNDGGPVLMGSWRIPPGKIGIISRWYGGWNTTVPQNKNPNNGIRRGSPDGESVVPLTGALQEVIEAGQFPNTPGLNAARPMQPRKMHLVLEADRYFMQWPNLLTDHSLGWFGWIFDPTTKPQPLVPIPSPNLVFQPDERCTPFMWECGINATRLGQFKVPQECDGVIEEVNYTLGQESFVGRLGIAQGGHDPTLVLTFDTLPLNGALTEVGQNFTQGNFIHAGASYRNRKVNLFLAGGQTYKVTQPTNTLINFVHFFGWTWLKKEARNYAA